MASRTIIKSGSKPPISPKSIQYAKLLVIAHNDWQQDSVKWIRETLSDYECNAFLDNDSPLNIAHVIKPIDLARYYRWLMREGEALLTKLVVSKIDHQLAVASAPPRKRRRCRASRRLVWD